MTIVEATRTVTGGIDTHSEVHVAAALDEVGGLLGAESFDANPAGYEALYTWMSAFGDVTKVGVEGTGSYGAGVARFLARAGVEVIEVEPEPSGPPSKRQVRPPRRRRGRPSRSLGKSTRPREEQGRFGRGHPGPRRGQALR
jgi:hypothetical protein